MTVTGYEVGPGAYGVAIAAHGAMWATLWAASSAVRLDQDGQVAGEASFRSGAEPHGLALAGDGTLWVALEAGSLAHVTT